MLIEKSTENKSSEQDLSHWLATFWRSPAFNILAERFKDVKDAITNSDETALLYAVIQHLRPKLTIEIGTFFACTSRIMAEAIVEANIDGRLITIDPFGEERVPAIVQSWPEALRLVTEFKPWTSMQLFQDLETRNAPKGGESSLSVVFVDGHHNFEYALFDIIRSADHLAPGGAIFVDNLEQEGPKVASIQFLSWNPAWRLFCGGNVVSCDNMFGHDFGNNNWGVLVAPEGLQVAKHPIKLMKRGLFFNSISGLSFNVKHISHPGKLQVNLNFFAFPYDYHITGEGLLNIRSQGYSVVSGAESKIAIDFPSTLKLEMGHSNYNVGYEIELSYQSAAQVNSYILFDAMDPMSLLQHSAAD